MTSVLNQSYYLVKPLVPRRLQLALRRQLIRYQAGKYQKVWPIDPGAAQAPQGWTGWPEGKKFALVLTHDVETARGHERVLQLMNLERGFGFRSSFNFVPLRYDVSDATRHALDDAGFEVGVHGLYHDGKYYLSKKLFQDRAQRINHYLKEWGAVGYRAPAMYHRLEWFHELAIEYDSSTFDTDPFEPNAKGVRTIFPYMVSNGGTMSGFVELPYTLPQDFTLFVLMRKGSIDIWKRKLDWLVQHGGLALINTHPDYMRFDEEVCGNEEYPARHYEEFLEYVKSKYEGQYWNPLPRAVASFWRAQADQEELSSARTAHASAGKR